MIITVTEEHISDLMILIKSLWPTAKETVYTKKINLSNEQLFLYYSKGQAMGFAQVSLRNDYVEGTASSPVGYLEGIYVLPNMRRKNIAFELLQACEHWAIGNGCSEFASDCTLDNQLSENFHLASGFEEVGQIRHFKKSLTQS
ncbi:aminoglycoside 6'-N-acetyltransferase [Marinilactibacillus kalidii]|uniref:aminoglycoside 6'-N-acetyltransferase n=1 Tax=Marinilactibacillus kalidii TaxID=2820274 RepID=UPI001FC98A0A|nr:aminoglycoside 6'-N-acetyltransferase [Marinilactibacillus kalidii]